MTGYSGVVTRKGQITIPVAIRRALNLNQGNRVAFVQENGSVRLRKSKTLMEQTAGMLSGYALDHVPIDAEMNGAVERAVVEDMKREGAI